MDTSSSVGLSDRFSDIFTAMNTFDVGLFDSNKEAITAFYKNEHSHTSCCDAPGCGARHSTSMFECMSRICGEGDGKIGPFYDHDRDEKWFASFKYLIENGTIDPNYIVHQKLLLASCLANFTGWKMQYERIDFLLAHTSPNIVRDFRDNAGKGKTVLLCLLSGHMVMKDEYFDKLYDALIATGIDINVVGEECFDGEMYKYQALYYFARSLDLKYVKIALDAGQDPNLFSSGTYFRKQNIAQDLLQCYQKEKRQKTILKLIEVFRMLIYHGLNLAYTDLDGRNLMDYVYQYKWDNTEIMTLLRTSGCPDITGIASSEKKFTHRSPDTDSISSALKFLYGNRYEKNPDRLEEILRALKRMKDDGANFSTEMTHYHDGYGRDENIYDAICLNGSWRDSDVADYLKIEVGGSIHEA
jgi:hypothetical protein